MASEVVWAQDNTEKKVHLVPLINKNKELNLSLYHPFFNFDFKIFYTQYINIVVRVCNL